MTINKQDPKYRQAKIKVDKIKKFYSELMTYCIIIIFLAILNYYNNEWRNPWFLWVVFGWGLGLIFKAAKVFDYFPFIGKNWERRKLKEFMDEEERSNF